MIMNYPGMRAAVLCFQDLGKHRKRLFFFFFQKIPSAIKHFVFSRQC